jgi:hypothetical protein
VNLTAAATPTGAGITGAVAPQLSIRVGNRTGTRQEESPFRIV